MGMEDVRGNLLEGALGLQPYSVQESRLFWWKEAWRSWGVNCIGGRELKVLSYLLSFELYFLSIFFLG